MNADEFIRKAIDAGQHGEVSSLNPLQRAIFLISELEVLCDKDGIDSFLSNYGAGDLRLAADLLAVAGATTLSGVLTQLADELPHPQEAILHRASDLISDRSGYDYDALVHAVAGRLGGGSP